MRVFGSCRQAGSFGSGQIKPISDEFHEDCGVGGTCEKFREGIAEGNGDDLFGGGQPWPNGPYPRAEGLPDQRGFGRGEDLKLEGHFDLESQTIDADDVQGGQGQIRAHQQDGAAQRMEYDDEADEDADRAPQ